MGETGSRHWGPQHAYKSGAYRDTHHRGINPEQKPRPSDLHRNMGRHWAYPSLHGMGHDPFLIILREALPESWPTEDS